MNLFNLDHGIVIECNFSSIKKLESIVESTNDLDFVVGYKVGAELAIASTISDVVQTIRKFTNLPIIYDHQKFGADDPGFCGSSFLETIKGAGIDAVFIFPFGGIASLKAAVDKSIETGLIPVVGGDMVHKGFITEDKGYLESSAPQKMYLDGADMGTVHFVIPCTRLDRMRIYCRRLESMVNNPVLFITGVGLDVCDDLIKACEVVKQHRSYAVIGKEITGEENYRRAAQEIWKKMPVNGA
jgi:orotidine-5'-phosphate decarboxylase